MGNDGSSGAATHIKQYFHHYLYPMHSGPQVRGRRGFVSCHISTYNRLLRAFARIFVTNDSLLQTVHCGVCFGLVSCGVESSADGYHKDIFILIFMIKVATEILRIKID